MYLYSDTILTAIELSSYNMWIFKCNEIWQKYSFFWYFLWTSFKNIHRIFPWQFPMGNPNDSPSPRTAPPPGAAPRLRLDAAAAREEAPLRGAGEVPTPLGGVRGPRGSVKSEDFHGDSPWNPKKMGNRILMVNMISYGIFLWNPMKSMVLSNVNMEWIG